MVHGFLAAATAAFAVGAQLFGPEIGALHAVKPIDRIDHWRLREGTHQLLKSGIAQAKNGVQDGLTVLVAVFCRFSEI